MDGRSRHFNNKATLWAARTMDWETTSRCSRFQAEQSSCLVEMRILKYFQGLFQATAPDIMIHCNILVCMVGVLRLRKAAVTGAEPSKSYQQAAYRANEPKD